MIAPMSRSDNINVHELGDMLRYLGFSVGRQTADSGRCSIRRSGFGASDKFPLAGIDHLYMLLAQVGCFEAMGLWLRST